MPVTMFNLIVILNINVENHTYWQKIFFFFRLTERIYFLGALLGSPLSDAQWEQASLPVASGGFVLRCATS